MLIQRWTTELKGEAFSVSISSWCFSRNYADIHQYVVGKVFFGACQYWVWLLIAFDNIRFIKIRMCFCRGPTKNITISRAIPRCRPKSNKNSHSCPICSIFQSKIYFAYSVREMFLLTLMQANRYSPFFQIECEKDKRFSVICVCVLGYIVYSMPECVWHRMENGIDPFNWIKTMGAIKQTHSHSQQKTLPFYWKLRCERRCSVNCEDMLWPQSIHCHIYVLRHVHSIVWMCVGRICEQCHPFCWESAKNNGNA